MAESSIDDDLDPRLVTWLIDVTGTQDLDVTRRTGGASRAGYAVDARGADGRVEELWLRTDPGFGPQSNTQYTLRREAAVYRALGPTPVKVAELVAVHPELEAFLMRRVPGDSRFARIDDAEAQRMIATAFMEQLAELHTLDATTLDLPELGPPGRLVDRLQDEIEEWERQYHACGGGVPMISLAGAWLRANRPVEAGWPVVLIQGDTGPGNFMFQDDELVAITDWELAHWGDPHDDVAWVLLRDALERFPDLRARIADYERASGFTVDPDRLRYFRVLAHYRSTIGTLAGIRTHDQRGEIAWQLIFNALHTRLLGEVLADATGASREPPLVSDDRDGHLSWVYDVALGDLRDVVVPGLASGFASNRAKGIARLLKYLREADRLGPELTRIELDDLAGLLGRRFDAVGPARQAASAAIEQGELAPSVALRYCLRQAERDTAIMAPAMGVLVERHADPF